MTKASGSLQDLRRGIYVKAKAEPSWRFWGLYVHVCKVETLREAYALARKNNGAPGIDGVTFEAIEERGVESFLEQLQGELVERTYRPLRSRPADTEGRGQGPCPIRLLLSVTAWCRVRSSSYWSRSSRQTSNRGRMVIVQSALRMKRCIGWRRR